MALSIPAISMDGTISAEQALLSVYKDRVVEERNIILSADVDIDNVKLDWRSSWEESEPHKPYLLMQGKVKAIRGDFPFDIGEVTLSGDNVFDVEMVYDFDDYELATLVPKGLFERDFECPRAFYQETLKDLPIRCNYKILEPVTDVDVPLVFMDVVDVFDIHLTTQTCGYRFSDSFDMSRLHQIKVDDMSREVATEKQLTSTKEKIDEFNLDNLKKLTEDLAVEQPVQSEVNEPTKADLDYVNNYLTIYSETRQRMSSKRPTLRDILNRIVEEDDEKQEQEEQMLAEADEIIESEPTEEESHGMPVWMMNDEDELAFVNYDAGYIEDDFDFGNYTEDDLYDTPELEENVILDTQDEVIPEEEQGVDFGDSDVQDDVEYHKPTKPITPAVNVPSDVDDIGDYSSDTEDDDSYDGPDF